MGFCVGFVEGVLIQSRLIQSVNLWKDHQYGTRNTTGEPGLLAFYERHLAWLNESISAFQDVLYWRRVNVIYQIFLGLFAGYNSVARPNECFELYEFYAYVALGDSAELKGLVREPQSVRIERLSHCTALIVLSNDKQDIYFSHDTWDDYRSLHVVMLHYNLPCIEFPASRVSLTTQLGLVSSCDDFFINSKGLMIFETTVTLQNRSLYDFVKPQTVMNWMRTILAAFVAENVSGWSDTFLAHNSGTYNNEYFVVDSKLLRGATQVSANLVHSVLQLPGPWRWEEDLTEELYREGFIASFNVPKNQAGAKFMQWERAGGAVGCSYSECPRYLISKRESPRLSDWETFKRFTRYAGYKRDAYSKWEGVPYHSYCVSSRGDTDDDPSLRIVHGGLNSKVCKASEVVTRMQIYGVNTPSYEYEPDQNWPLDWNMPPLSSVAHDGLPDVWTFTNWVGKENSGYEFCEKLTKKGDCVESNFCGWCEKSALCKPGDQNGPFFNATCDAGWTTTTKEVNTGLIIGLSIAGAVVLIVIVVIAIALWQSNKQNGIA
jgi:hypothetical protein